MADETKTPDASTDAGADAAADAAADRAAPVVHCHTQYVKDLSFENPNAADAMAEADEAPEVEVNVRLSVATARDNMYEVTLSLEGRARRRDRHLFLVSLDYAGLFTIANIPAEHGEAVLHIHCPSLLFPFARQIIAEVTRNGGYPPLLINSVDFATLYENRRQGPRPAAAPPPLGGDGAGA